MVNIKKYDMSVYMVGLLHDLIVLDLRKVLLIVHALTFSMCHGIC